MTAAGNGGAEIVRVDGWTVETIDSERRIGAFQVATRGGMLRARDVKPLIDRNRAELESHGAISVRETVSRTEIPGSTKFREDIIVEPMLNEGQAYNLVALMRTAQASALRVSLIKLFLSLRRGELEAVRAQRPQLDETIVSSARIGDDPAAMAELRQAIRRVCDARGYSKAKVIGYVRKIRTASTPWAVSMHLLAKTIESLEAIENNHHSLLSPREERLLAAAKRAERNGQLKLFKGGRVA